MGFAKRLKGRIFKPLCAFSAKSDAAGKFKSIEEIPYQRELLLRIPTYDGSFQAVHPDVVCTDSFPGRDARTPRFVLAFTPYPFSVDQFENPSLLVSQDGIRFREEFPGGNPLAPTPETDHNDDPDLFYEDGCWRIFYLETLRPACQNLRLLESRDRKTWGNRVVLSMDFRDKADWRDAELFMLSPAYRRRISDGAPFLYYVNMQKAGNTVEYLRLADGYSADKAERNFPELDLTADGGQKLNPWHLDILEDGGAYYMLLTTVATEKDENRYSLFLSRSTDLQRWTRPAPVLADSYRASGFFLNGDLYIFFSREIETALSKFLPFSLKIWRVGVYRTRIEK